ncbi:hypothetical protein [Chamaesiphon sp. VAR_48_metabat_403]|uniref:hypothetical protein n=1 Tax=Chamaesiphon sp. VAR_48_metabat_403 TaxID=2964700 RepID=UPI00286EA867|nr:hypothetical protein [Chamaesiphon sp. VAR_48_metabat_403]
MNSPATFDDYLATPIIIYPQMDEAEFKYEFERMRSREAATTEFVTGQIDAEDFLEVLSECGTSIDDALSDWKNGISYMG